MPELKFPVVICFPEKIRDTGYKYTHHKFNKDLYDNWLNLEWPSEEEFMPGYVLDSTGWEYPTLGLSDWKPCPKWFSLFAGIGCTYLTSRLF